MTVTGALNAAARETAATVTLSISGGTAVAGDDFTVVQDVVLTIPARSTSGTVAIHAGADRRYDRRAERDGAGEWVDVGDVGHHRESRPRAASR